MARGHERGPPERERPALAGTGALEKTGKDEDRRYKESRTESPVPSSRLADLAARIKVEHAACVAAVKKSAEHAMAAGDALTEAKAQLKHGEWLPWLKSHCEISERTAQVYMRLARHGASTVSKSAAEITWSAASTRIFAIASPCSPTRHSFAGDRQHEGVLKALITEPTVIVEPNL
jgi:hypothetical protein